MPEKKKPTEMTTREALRHLFPKRLRDALEGAVSDVTDPTPDGPPAHEKHLTKEP